MDIELLNKELEIAENPGMDTFDSRFSDIASLVENGDFIGAASQAEEVLTEGLYDIRIIGYFLYGIFLEQGVSGLSSIYRTIILLLQDNWEALGPIKKKEKHAQNSLNWFFKQVEKKLGYEEEKKSDVWEVWMGEVTSEDVEGVLDAGAELQSVLGRVLEEASGPVLDTMAKVKEWLKAFQKLVYREPEPEEEPGPEPEEVETGDEEPEEGYEEEEAYEEPEEEFVAPGPAAALSAMAGDMAAEGSYHLKILLKKLDTFDRLIHAGKYSLAAVVADDINNIVAKFDPKLYFPKMFAGFSVNYAQNISQLHAFEESKGSAQWKALKELYKVDIESFMALDADFDFSSGDAEGGYGESEEEEYEDHYSDDEYEE